MESHFNVLAPENAPYYEHIYEGPDDMPAHIKASLLGASQSLPISNGKLNIGIWQAFTSANIGSMGGREKSW